MHNLTPDIRPQPRVSVLLVTYNQENYITQAIESALMQKTNFDYEIVIGEDRSTDSTRKIVCRYSDHHPTKIHLLLQPCNVGGRANFSGTFLECHGEFVALLEGDDYWTSPEKLQRQVDFLDRHPECAMCFHNVTESREDGIRRSWGFAPPGKKEISDLEDLLPKNFIATSSVMFRRSLGNNLPNGIALGDWAIHIFNAQHGQIGYLDEIMGVYRIHKKGWWSGRSFREMLEGEIEFYRYMHRHLSPKYKDIIEAELLKRHALLLREQTRGKTEDWLERLRHDIKYQQLAAQIREAIRSRLPPDAGLIVFGHGENALLKLGTRLAWNFPRIQDSEQEKLFAEGPYGTKQVPWLRAGFVYDFRLYAGKQHRRRIANTDVVLGNEPHDQDLSDFNLHSREMAFEPKVVSTVPTIRFTKETISWNTGNGVSGQVYVACKNILDIPDPVDNAAAIAEVEELIVEGGEFLLAPRSAFTFFERYPDLKEYLDHHYRVVEDGDICRIYDLRETLQKTGGHDGQMGNQIEIS